MSDIILATSFQGTTYGVVLFITVPESDIPKMDRSRLLHCYLIQSAIIHVYKHKGELSVSDNPVISNLPDQVEAYMKSVTDSGQVGVDATVDSVLGGIKKSNKIIKDLFPTETKIVDACVSDTVASYIAITPKSIEEVVSPCMKESGIVIVSTPYEPLIKGFIADVKARSTEVADFIRQNESVGKEYYEMNSQLTLAWLKTYFSTTSEYQAYFQKHHAPKEKESTEGNSAPQEGPSKNSSAEKEGSPHQAQEPQEGPDRGRTEGESPQAA